ncbi:MAG: hypothetical protein AAF363_10270 [Bacteroidota bacterium]
MGTKQKIIYRSEIEKDLGELKGKEFNLILKNGISYFVKFISFNNSRIEVRNMYNHKLGFDLSEIEEIILEVKYA